MRQEYEGGWFEFLGLMSRVNQNFFSSRVQRTQTQRTVRTQPFCLEPVIVLHGRNQVTCMVPCSKREEEEEPSKAWSMD